MTVIHSIKRRMSGLPAEVGRKVQQKAYSVRTSAESTVRAKRGATQGTELLSLPIGPRAGCLDATVKLSEVSQGNVGLLQDALRVADIDFWCLEISPQTNPTINVLGPDFALGIVELAKSPEFSSWYFQQLAPNGTAFGPTRFIATAAKDLGEAAGIRLWRYVAPTANSSFYAGEEQYVDLVKWLPTETATHVEAAVWNSKTVELPHPQLASEQFTQALDAANEATGHFCDFPIDAVITWVDGDDPDWQQRKNEALGQDQTLLIRDATDDARFEPLDELRYCLRSIEQYAPWIRTIYLVTDRQVPPWLKQDSQSRVKIVDHTEIWEDQQQLPVFNSHAIEANLHHIDGLSEHFLYLNDDMILTSPVSPEVFFHPSGVGKVFYSRALVDFAEVSTEDNVSTVAAKNARQVLTGDGLPSMNRKYYHAPYPLSRSVMQEIETTYPHLCHLTSGAKFRSMSDVALAGSFYFSYALAKGYAVPGRIRYDYIDPADSEALSRLRGIIRRRNTQSIVVNDGSQAVDKSERERLKRLVPKLLRQLLPVPSSFEA